MVATTAYDLVVLDLSLPDGDGTEILALLRGRTLSVPVLAATARDRVGQRVAGLNMGMDDYVTKPYDLDELTARIRALLRRPGLSLGLSLSCGNLTLDTVTMAVAVAARPLVPGRRQTLLLEGLLRAAGRVVSRTALEERMYGIDDLVESNALDANVSRLRRLLSEAGCSATIHTVRGVGYMLGEL